jgi:hypothetical protein
VRTLVPASLGGGNLFSVDSQTLAVRQLPITGRLEYIVAGEGQLWGLPDEGRNLLSIKASTGEVRSRRLRPAGGLSSLPSGVVALGRLWLSCNRVIAAYEPSGGASTVLRSPRSFHLLASSAGVWAVQAHVLVGVTGHAYGRRIVLGAASKARLWQARGNEAWALDRRLLNTLIEVNLATGAIHRFPLATHGQHVDGFVIGSNHIWVSLTTTPLILLFDRFQPRRPSAQVDLSKAADSRDFQIFLTAGPSDLWVALFANRHFKLFRVTALK